MSNENMELIRRANEAHSGGDAAESGDRVMVTSSSPIVGARLSNEPDQVS
jgi:hypothetical protein